MNIIFFGSAEFAVPSLGSLLKSGHKISMVVTQPDRAKGRGLALSATPVKQFCKDEGIKVYQPEDINSAESQGALKKIAADLFVVIAYGQILSAGVLSLPKIFSINLHASILPKLRGAAPVNRALISGESHTGITIIKLNAKMDAGPIISQKAIEILPEDDVISLEKRLATDGAGLLLGVIKNIEDKRYSLKDQDEGMVSLAPKLKKQDGLIDWGRPAADINNLVRGCIDWPGAFTYYQGKILKIYKTQVLDKRIDAPAGRIIEAGKGVIEIATGSTALAIEELQLEGKKRMGVEEFLCGHKIQPNDSLG